MSSGVELETDLRAQSDQILRTLDQLETLENEKRRLEPGNPRFLALAAEIEKLAASLYAHSHMQKDLGEKARAVSDMTGIEVAPIDDVPPARDVQHILTEWRDAERRLAAAAPGSSEQSAAAADVGRLREEYHRAYTAGANRAD